jgi:hypothetical protein
MDTSCIAAFQYGMAGELSPQALMRCLWLLLNIHHFIKEFHLVGIKTMPACFTGPVLSTTPGRAKLLTCDDTLGHCSRNAVECDCAAPAACRLASQGGRLTLLPFK